MLRDTQGAFAASLFAGDSTAAPHIRPGKLGSERRLDIYRHNVFTNLRNVLGDIFPVVKQIVGDAFFVHAANEFIRAHASVSGDLNQYGREWPAFIAAYPHAADLPYLADVARLEWAWHECFHAAEFSALDLTRLAGIPAESHGDLIFALHPAVQLLSSAFPILQIWQVNQPDFGGPMDIDWDAGGDALLVRRDGADNVEVVIEGIAPAAHQFLSRIAGGASLEAAASAALADDPEFDLQGFLIRSVQCGVIVDFSGS